MSGHARGAFPPKRYGAGPVAACCPRRKKAHPDVHGIVFHVFDKGRMEDSEGGRIDSQNTLILRMSNVGSEEIMSMMQDGEVPAETADLADALRRPLLEVFPAAMLGRVVTIPYYPLSDAMIEAIAEHKLRALAKHFGEGRGVDLVIGAGVMDVIKARCTEIECGGRMIDAILTDTLLPELDRRILTWRLEGRDLTRVTVTGGPDGFGYDFE